MLQACVFHHGESARSGHYTASCASLVNGEQTWLLRDDEKVSEARHPAETAAWQARTGAKVYMLLYQRAVPSVAESTTARVRPSTGEGSSASGAGAVTEAVSRHSHDSENRKMVEAGGVPSLRFQAEPEALVAVGNPG